ncbi:MAG: hypothetical protein RL077_3923, partial [Verrucomicrobiota bacterium]
MSSSLPTSLRLKHLLAFATQVAFLVLTTLLTRPTRAATPPPNIILILADDLGFETIRANGGTSYLTPVLDRLAANGVRFT